VEVGQQDERQLRARLQSIAREWGIPSVCWRIFECSGTPAGQRLAFSLLAAASTMVQVGYTHEKVELRLSNLMAHDAEVHGTWGCPPEEYPAVLDLIYRGEVVLEPFIDHAPMSDLNRLLGDMAAHRLRRRMVLHPEQ
jgi:6-hydroxycyclohex-1-ene-1-carbonyl-CoA dehydrogenase